MRGDWKPGHIDLADRADLLLIAPATANIIAELAHGLAGNPIAEIALATLAPVLIAPAMNGKMWQHAGDAAQRRAAASRAASNSSDRRKGCSRADTKDSDACGTSMKSSSARRRSSPRKSSRRNFHRPQAEQHRVCGSLPAIAISLEEQESPASSEILALGFYGRRVRRKIFQAMRACSVSVLIR